ncbi:MAG: histidinol-phosphate aminotransferase [Desulfobulbaceae bacterium BRH_c16a]|nr:MAG: histidinol-phosphate aminotransferase [Desulfobulbaceae bacterium BRH_c16a]
MSRFYSDTVRSITPYVPGEQPKDRSFIKLNTNENPYPASPMAVAAIHSVSGVEARLYPDPEVADLRRTLAAYHGLEIDRIFVGNGSDEVLAMMYPAFFNRTDTIAFPDITYSFYPVYAALYEIPFTAVPLSEDFTVDFRDYPNTLKALLLANPNAPTAIAVSAGEIEAQLKLRPDTLIIVDEAYVDFGAESVIPLTRRHDNLLVIQTMSKARSLAGLRVGMAFGNPELIRGLECIRDSFNSYTLDVVAQRAAKASYEDVAYFEQTRRAIIATREKAVAALAAIGFTVLPSSANFVFCTMPGKSGAEVQQYLRDNGVLVRRFNTPRIKEWLRITIGTDEEMDEVLRLLRLFVQEKI